MTDHPCILVWSRDAAFGRSVSEALEPLVESQGIRVQCMENPEQVMSEVLDDRTDLLICDLEHSFRHDVTALRNCRRVRPRLPLIILTSTFDEAFRTEVLPIGIHYYMTRDFEPTELLESVRSALGIVKQAR